MSFLKKIFKSGSGDSSRRGFHKVKIARIQKLTPDATQITFEITPELKNSFEYKPGQYINLSVLIDNKEERRSYSICSAQNEGLSIGVKEVEGGKVSNYLTRKLKEGDSIEISEPIGSFILSDNSKNIVAIAAGSGITPIMSMAKNHTGEGRFNLFFGNTKESDIMFKGELESLKNVDVQFYLSKEEKDGFRHGRIDKDQLSDIIKSDLSLLKADAFMLCGPIAMIESSTEVLKTFGVSEKKIHFELFTPVEKSNEPVVEQNTFKGESTVHITIDHEEEIIKVKDNQQILDTGLNEGLDLPYSCKGGVCSSCKALLLKGDVHINMNYVLTDNELEEGYILTCQSQPRSEEIKLTYDI